MIDSYRCVCTHRALIVIRDLRFARRENRSDESGYVRARLSIILAGLPIISLQIAARRNAKRRSIQVLTINDTGRRWPIRTQRVKVNISGPGNISEDRLPEAQARRLRTVFLARNFIPADTNRNRFLFSASLARRINCFLSSRAS